MAACVSASMRSAPRGQRPWHVRTLLAREPGDLRSTTGLWPSGPRREGDEPKPAMHEREKSDPAIVATKPANAPARAEAERVEPRAGAEENADRTARPGHRAGKARPTAWAACGKPYASPPTSKVGAGCLNWARPVLCGGRPVMGVPTAIANYTVVAPSRAQLKRHPEAPARSNARSTIFAGASDSAMSSRSFWISARKRQSVSLASPASSRSSSISA